MEAEVPQDVLRRAVRCRKDIECLRTGRCGHRKDCEVDYAVGQDVLFLRSASKPPGCGYRLRYGDRQVCMCPVHFALWQRQTT